MGVPKTAVMSAIDSVEGTLTRLTAPRTQGLKYTLAFALRQAEDATDHSFKGKAARAAL